MKKALLLVAVIAIGTVAFIIKKSRDNVRESPPISIEYNYSYDKKEVFNDDASSDLAEVDQKIKELSEKTALASDMVKTNVQPKIQALRTERAALGKKLDALKNAEASNWNDLKFDYQKSASEMKATLKEDWQWLAEKTSS